MAGSPAQGPRFDARGGAKFWTRLDATHERDAVGHNPAAARLTLRQMEYGLYYFDEGPFLGDRVRFPAAPFSFRFPPELPADFSFRFPPELPADFSFCFPPELPADFPIEPSPSDGVVAVAAGGSGKGQARSITLRRLVPITRS